MAQTSKIECRWAFLGLSSIAELFLRDLSLPRSEDDPICHRLVSVSTTGSITRAKDWLKQQNVPELSTVAIFQDYETMFRRGNFDVVYISSPHGVHFKHARSAIEHGCNVLLEKPAVMNHAQFVRLTELAKARGVVFMEAMWTRYFPLTRHIQDHLLPQIGVLKRIIADYSLPLFGDPTLDPQSRFLNKSSGSGSLLDLGVYPLTWVDIATGGCSSSGSPSAALTVKYAETIVHETPAEPIDDITTIILSRVDDPMTAIVTISSSLPGSARLGIQDRLLLKKNAPCLRIQGTKAEISLPFPPIRPETCTIQYYEPGKLDANGFEREDTVTKEVYGWGLWYQADVIASRVFTKKHDGLNDGDSLLIGNKGSAQVLEWVDQARRLAGIRYDAELEKVW